MNGHGVDVGLLRGFNRTSLNLSGNKPALICFWHEVQPHAWGTVRLRGKMWSAGEMKGRRTSFIFGGFCR